MACRKMAVAYNTYLSLTNNLILNNESVIGGEILGYSWGADAITTIILTNNIIAGNRAKYGSGIFSCSGKTGPDITQPEGKISWELTNNTITGNIASEGDGIHLHSGSDYGDGGKITFSSKNDIIWGNISPNNGPQVNVIVDPGKPGAVTADISYTDVGPITIGRTGTYSLSNTLDDAFVCRSC